MTLRSNEQVDSFEHRDTRGGHMHSVQDSCYAGFRLSSVML